jgi:hypothetical protein
MGIMIYNIDKLRPWKQDQFADSDWALYFQTAKLIQECDERERVQLFEKIRERYTKRDDNDELQSKLFILIRIVFDLPVKIDSSMFRSFKGWDNWPKPDDSGKVSVSWPIGWEKGKPFLADFYKGSSGKPYALKEEYEYFKKAYAYRKISGIENGL